MGPSGSNLNRILTMFSLIIAGEAIFTLPFHITQYFRPTFVDVFGFSQTELGMLGSIYGVIAMISYIFGGPLADRFPARKLLAFALLVTGSTGFYLLTIPSFPEEDYSWSTLLLLGKSTRRTTPPGGAASILAVLHNARPTCTIVTIVKGGPPRFRFDPSPRRDA